MSSIKVEDCIARLRAKLKAKDIDNSNELNVLFELAFGKRPSELLGEKISTEQNQKLDVLVARRVSGEPLQYIAGSWPFLDFELEIGVGVLIPRPETEELATRAIEIVNQNGFKLAYDLCSGSGCIAIAIKRACPQIDVTAVELSEQALVYLRKNADKLCPSLKAVCGDVLEFDRQIDDESIDLITANPPYVTPSEYMENESELKNEPLMAFIGGDDGLDFYRYIIPNYKQKLVKGGVLIFETGFNQTERVAALFRDSGYTNIQIHCDIYGVPRNVSGAKG